MDVEQLEIFAEVMRVGSFAAVARERRVAPSSVSRNVSSLEEELGVRLLSRTTRKLTPTEAGTLFFDRLEVVLDELTSAMHVVHDAGETARGTLRVTAPITFAELNLVPLLPDFVALHQELKLELAFTDRIVDLVEERMDIAVRLGRLAPSSLVATKLCEMRYVLCASPRYLATHGTPASPEELTEHACLRYPVPGYGARWRFRRDGEELDVPVEGRLSASSSIALRDLALADLGLLMMPRWNVAHELAAGTLVPLLEDWDKSASELDIGVWLLYPSRAYLPLKVRVFIDFLRTRFADGSPAEAVLRD
jgi:DNA-binding transcriptional LysR family regulator